MSPSCFHLLKLQVCKSPGSCLEKTSGAGAVAEPMRRCATRWVGTRREASVFRPKCLGSGTQVETDIISTLPVVRKLGHEWNFSFLWVNVSQSNAITTDGKILYRARSSSLLGK